MKSYVTVPRPVLEIALNSDYWTEREDSPRGPALIIDEILDAIPLDSTYMAGGGPDLPPKLAAALFLPSPPDPSQGSDLAAQVPGGYAASLKTYAILDAAKIPFLPEFLDASGLEHRCLFTGKALEELGSVAPWLVELEQENSFTRDLLTRSDAPRHHWGKEAGIFIRTGFDLDETFQHFRKFTRLQDASGKWLFFRFWEPLTTAAYMSSLILRPSEASRWFAAGAVATILIPSIRDGSLIRVAPREGLAAVPHRAVIISDSDRLVLAGARTKGRLNMLSDLLAKSFPDINSRSRDELDNLVWSTVQRMQYYGILQAKALFTACAWELAHGPQFETRDPNFRLQQILLSQRDESEKMVLLRARMAELALPVCPA